MAGTQTLETGMMPSRYPRCSTLNTKGKQPPPRAQIFSEGGSWRSFRRMMGEMPSLTSEDGLCWLTQREAGMMYFPSVVSREGAEGKVSKPVFSLCP